MYGSMHLKSFLADFKKMLRCVYEVSLAVMEETKQLSVDFSEMANRIEDIEGHIRVEGEEVEDI